MSWVKHPQRCKALLTDTCAHSEPHTDKESCFHLHLTTQSYGPQSQGLLMNATLNLIWGDANCGVMEKCWRHFDFSSPAALIKKNQLSICKTFLRWTPYKLLRCNLCTVSSLFNREICPNSDWTDFPKAGTEGYFLTPSGNTTSLIHFWIIPDWAEAEHENKALVPQQND